MEVFTANAEPIAEEMISPRKLTRANNMKTNQPKYISPVKEDVKEEDEEIEKVKADQSFE